MSDQPTCFVIMGFDKKTDYGEKARTLDPEATYAAIIKRVTEECGLACIRAVEVTHSVEGGRAAQGPRTGVMLISNAPPTGRKALRAAFATWYSDVDRMHGLRRRRRIEGASTTSPADIRWLPSQASCVHDPPDAFAANCPLRFMPGSISGCGRGRPHCH